MLKKTLAFLLCFLQIGTVLPHSKWIKPATVAKRRKAVTKYPIVYHSGYNIGFFGLQKILHEFDGEKYGRIHTELMRDLGLSKEQFYQPAGMVSDKDLLKVHTQRYLNSLGYSYVVAIAAEVWPLMFVPNWVLRRKLLKPMKLATQGTIDALQLALKYGWAVNLSGGYHHAKNDAGEGSCIYADIPLAVIKAWEKDPNLKVMTIDLDAHRGNGIADIFKNDKRVHIFDVYNKNMYPLHDPELKKYISTTIEVTAQTKSEEYLALIKAAIPKAITEFNPDIIIFNAGTDIYEKDVIGGLKVTAEDIVKRDEFVFKLAKEKNIPILMTLSGGYTAESHEIVSSCLKNILKNVIKIFG